VDQLSPPTFQTFTSSLRTRIQSDPESFLSPPRSWVKCISPEDIHDCAIVWARESNAFTCSYVYRDFADLDDFNTVDLGGPYFEGAVPIVETQVAKGNAS